MAAEEHVATKEAATRPANFLFDELVERFKNGPVQFRMVAQLAANGDPIVDASQVWPQQRPQVELYRAS
jgi:catalase